MLDYGDCSGRMWIKKGRLFKGRYQENVAMKSKRTVTLAVKLL